VIIINLASSYSGFCDVPQGNENTEIETVLFSIVALKTLDISQGSVVATHLSCGEIFSDSIITRFLLILAVK